MANPVALVCYIEVSKSVFEQRFLVLNIGYVAEEWAKLSLRGCVKLEASVHHIEYIELRHGLKNHALRSVAAKHKGVGLLVCPEDFGLHDIHSGCQIFAHPDLVGLELGAADVVVVCFGNLLAQ